MNVAIPRARALERPRTLPLDDAVGTVVVRRGALPGLTLACLGRSHRSDVSDRSDGCWGRTGNSESARGDTEVVTDGMESVCVLMGAVQDVSRLKALGEMEPRM